MSAVVTRPRRTVDSSPMPPNPTTATATLASHARSLARLLDSVDCDDRFARLGQELAANCRYDNFLVYLFRGSTPPELVGSNLDEGGLQREMANFVSGVFLLDPFVLAADRGVDGLVRLEDIMPDDFRESEYFNRHYRFTNLLDELRYLIPIGSERIVHVFIERELPGPGFSAHEIALLRAVEPIVRSYVQARFRWRDQREGGTERHAATIDLQARIRAMAPDVLTRRECEIISLMLRGHSAKSISYALRIEEGTVTSHKRNIYGKLGIHSQAQLFDLFLRSLAAI